MNFNDNKNTKHQENILKVILECGKITKSGLSEVLGIRPATVIPIVDSLQNQGIIEIDTSTKKGRSVFYRICPSGKLSLGVHIGYGNIGAVLIDFSGKKYIEESVSFAIPGTPDELYSSLKKCIKNILKSPECKPGKLLGIGIAAPGIIKDGTSSSVITGEWCELRLLEIVSKEFNLPVLLENDTRCSLIAERWLGDACGVKNVTFVDANTKDGVGIAVLQDDKVMKGGNGGSVEFGHVTIKYDGAYCKCGNRGCLETYLSNKWLRERTAFHIERGIGTAITSDDVNSLELELLVDRAKDNDKVAVVVLEELAEIMGIGMTTALNLFSSNKIIIGGDVVACEPWFFDITRQVVRKKALSPYLQDIDISFSRLNAHSSVIGAAIVHFVQLFDGAFPNELIIE